MATIENTPQRLVLRSGSTTLTLDGEMGKVSMQRKMLFWNRAPRSRKRSPRSSMPRSIRPSTDRPASRSATPS